MVVGALAAGVAGLVTAAPAAGPPAPTALPAAPPGPPGSSTTTAAGPEIQLRSLDPDDRPRPVAPRVIRARAPSGDRTPLYPALVAGLAGLLGLVWSLAPARRRLEHGRHQDHDAPAAGPARRPPHRGTGDAGEGDGAGRPPPPAVPVSRPRRRGGGPA